MSKAKGFVDLHQHVLWGLDDGPQTPEEMHQLLRADVMDGIRVVAATSHALPGIQPFDMELYNARIAEAQAYCDANCLSLRLITGAEIRYTPSMVSMLQDKRLPTIGGSEYVLVEFWYSVTQDIFENAISQLFRHGFIPIVAHVERYALFHRNLEFVLSLKDNYEVYYQTNCGFILQRKSITSQYLRHRLLNKKVIDFVATDAHSISCRPPRLSQTADYLGNQKGLFRLIPIEDDMLLYNER